MLEDLPSKLVIQKPVLDFEFLQARPVVTILILRSLGKIAPVSHILLS